MRNDIAKVICERPRVGGVRKRSHRRQLNRVDGETDPKGESMHRRRLYSWAAKEFSDFLEPLKGFLAKSVGRPWNKVYAELAALLPKDTTTGRHVWTHVDGYVERHAVFENGRVYNPEGRGGYRIDGGKLPRSLRELSRGDLYVSAHGLLMRYRKAPAKRTDGPPAAPTACQLISRTAGYVKQGGAWWHVTFQVVPFDADAFGLYGAKQCQAAYGRVKGDPPVVDGLVSDSHRRAISKRLMSKRDVKRFVLQP